MQHLFKERTRRLNAAEERAGGYVLYWMRTAVRAWENPALDEAIHAANQLGIPVFVYHAVSERYPYASDRHHTFILEGARDVAAQLGARGIATAFHCERPGHRGPHLRTLAAGAALVITEEMPVSPLREWTRSLANSASVAMWAVDTACVVPMRSVGSGITRAFEYRKAASTHLDSALEPWEAPRPVAAPRLPDLPFEPLAWDAISIPELVAECSIDHSVAPVPHTRGGSTAGYARWEEFKRRGLTSYARSRNDPNQHGTSRMSAYLHYGMVSATRLAREATDVGGPGANKFLDELLVWRELAYTWCLYHHEHHSLAALPSWARETLQRHASDPRPAVPGLEALQRAHSGEPLWDLAQTSLLVHGELHNNVRMTWGKALLSWTRGPEEALQTLIDLNHRYALDGRDPASYGGLLWCLGQFDRPFPESPIAGRVRGRSMKAHETRLDMERWAAHVRRPLVHRPPSIAVVGGGPAGAMCARTLHDHGIDVVVFDKSRGAGGRTSTRRMDGMAFDHGAQYLTARSPLLARHVQNWVQAGVLAEWQGAVGTLGSTGFAPQASPPARFVGTPSMSALVKHLLHDVRVEFKRQITQLERASQRWKVVAGTTDLGVFDHVVVAVPAPQAAPLLHPHPFADTLEDTGVQPCWTVLATAPRAELPWVGARVKESPLGWIARNQTKPGRADGPEQLVLQATSEWSQLHLEDEPPFVMQALVRAARECTGLDLEGVSAHRWRFALVDRPVGKPFLYDPEAGLSACGDAMLGGRVESALASGAALAGRILGEITDRDTPAQLSLLS